MKSLIDVILSVLFLSSPLLAFDIEHQLFAQGMARFNEAKYENAADNFGQVIDMQPENHTARYYYAMALLCAGHKKQALENLKILQRAFPENVSYKRLAAKLAKETSRPLLNKNEPTQKEQKAKQKKQQKQQKKRQKKQKAKQKSGKNGGKISKSGESSKSSKNSGKSSESSESSKSSKSSKNSGKSSKNSGKSGGKKSKVKNQNKNAGERESESVLRHEIAKASSLIDSEKYDEAETILKSALSSQTNCPAAAKYLGCIAYYRRAYKQSLEYLEQAIQAELKDFDLYFTAGSVCKELKENDRAIGYLLEALSIKSDTFARLELASVYRRCFNWNEAERLYKEILNTDSAVDDAKLGLINIRLEQGFASETIELANSFLSREPNNADALFIKAKAYMAVRSYDKALEAAEKACNISNSTKHRCFKLLADVRRFNIEPAIEELKKILIDEPTCVSAAEVLAEAFMTLGEADKAKAVLFKLESLCKTPQTSYLLALTEVFNENYDKAEKYYEEFLTRSSNSPLAMLEYAKFKEVQANKSEAIAAYERVIDKFETTFFAQWAAEAIKRLKETDEPCSFGALGGK